MNRETDDATRAAPVRGDGVGVCLAFTMLCLPGLWAETELTLVNPGFERQSEGWSKGTAMSTISEAAAHTGIFGLRIVDTDTNGGSSFTSSPVDIVARRAYAVRFWGRALDSSGVGVYIRFLDEEGRSLNTPARRNEICLPIPENRKWSRYTIAGKAPPSAVHLSIWLHSMNAATASADLDDFTVWELTEEEGKKMVVANSASRRDGFKIPAKERIDEIAQMLSVQPAPLGRPASDRTAWDFLVKLPGAGGVVEAAERYAKDPPPDVPDELYLEYTQNGNRTRYQRPYGRRSSRLSTFLRAECLESKGRFLGAIEREALAICDERSWVMPAHDNGLTNFNNTRLYIDLGSSARAWLLATTDGWLGDRLGGETRGRIREEITRRIWDPYLAAIREGAVNGNWWMKTTNNWNAVCTAGVVGSALAIMDDRQVRAELLAAMEISNPYFLSGFTDDGYCSEGMGYWNYGFGHYMMLGHMVLEATQGKLNIFQNPKLHDIAAYPFNFQIEPGLSPAFADCSVNAKPSGDVLALIKLAFPDAVPDGVTFPSPETRGPTTMGLLGFRPETAALMAAESAAIALPIRSWFGEAGILVSRGRGPVQFGAAVKAGHNAEHHNHNDVGSFVVALDGKALLLDPGGEVYTRRTFSRQRYVSKVLNSYGHPVPVVAGELQKTGRSAAGNVLETDYTPDLDRLVIDLSSPYAVPELTKLIRTFVHDRARRVVEVRDDVAFSVPKPFGTALVTFDRVHRNEAGEVVVYDTRRGVSVTVSAEGGQLDYALEEIENPNRPSPKRLGFTFTEPVKVASVTFTIRPLESLSGLPGVYAAPDEAEFGPRVDEAILIEAERFATQSGGEVTRERKVGSSGTAIKYWDDEGHSLEWRFKTPLAGRYAIQVRACHGASATATRVAALDGKPLGEGKSILFPPTGGWSSNTDDWEDVWLAREGKVVIADLEPGEHTLKMTNDCGLGINLDVIRIVPVR